MREDVTLNHVSKVLIRFAGLPKIVVPAATQQPERHDSNGSFVCQK